MREEEGKFGMDHLQARLEELSAQSIPAMVAELAARIPHRLALSAQSARGHRDRLTFRQVETRMVRLAGAFRDRGIAPGDRVATFLTNDSGLEFILTALGALALGAAIVPLNTRASDDELAHAIALVGPSVIVTGAHSVDRLRNLAPEKLMFLIVGEGQAAAAAAWPDPDMPAPAAALPAVDPESLGCLLFTSGTTGVAKAVMSSHRTMLATGLCTGNALGLEAGDVYQAGFPVFTSSALNLALMSCWVAGAALVLEGNSDNDQRLALISSEGTTFYHGVPAVLNFMMQAYDPARHDLSRVRCVANGGAAMPPAVVEAIRRRLPWTKQVQIYGLTESGPAGTVLDIDAGSHPDAAVGRAMPLYEVAIVDDDGNRLPPGEMGEILISGPGVATGYYRNPENTRSTFAGRSVRTGDVGRLDGDGYLFFSDRKKDIINRGGLKIASVAVEHVLHDHPSVKEAAVVAVPHPDLGEDVGAMVVLHAGKDTASEELREFCAGRLADYAVPRHWRFVAELPRNPMGKVLKTEVKERFRNGPPIRPPAP